MGRRRLTIEVFITRSNKVHNNRYDYSKVEYVDSKHNVCIICPEHGEFWQTPNNHLRGNTCKKCSITKSILTIEEFIIKANNVHNFIYDYSKVIYTKTLTKVCIICPTHGEFWQSPNVHLSGGSGCHKCKVDDCRSNTNEFTTKANKVHNNKYDYSKVDYINSNIKVCLICPEHGEFNQRVNDHLSGCGCPKCNESKGERCIRSYLETYNIPYNSEYKIKECKNKRTLPFDFYLPKHNILIEYDGRQHFEPIIYFGGVERFNDQQIIDKIKTDYVNSIDGLTLLRISYKEFDNIYDILKGILLNER